MAFESTGPAKMSQASPSRRPNTKGRAATRDVESGTTLGQFAYAPAIETTVVTTIKKTTTKFPPFLVRPPKRSAELDHKQYPLAGAKTPAALKNIRFSLNGRDATFHEAEDTSIAIQQVS
jgi:F-box and WD-40 domain protein CDC4